MLGLTISRLSYPILFRSSLPFLLQLIAPQGGTIFTPEGFGWTVVSNARLCLVREFQLMSPSSRQSLQKTHIVQKQRLILFFFQLLTSCDSLTSQPFLPTFFQTNSKTWTIFCKSSPTPNRLSAPILLGLTLLVIREELVWRLL